MVCKLEIDPPSLRLGFRIAWIMWLVACFTIEPLHGEEADPAEHPEEEPEIVEPIITEETLPNRPGELSLRLTGDYRKQGADVRGRLPSLQVFYGIVDRLGAELGLPLVHVREQGEAHYGLGDASVGLKYVLVEPRTAWLGVVAGLEAEFPTGSRSRELGEGAWALTPLVAVVKDFQWAVLQGGFGWSRQVNREQEDRVEYGWALAVPVWGRRLHVLAEVNGDWGKAAEVSFSPGVKYGFNRQFSAGLALPIGLNRRTSDWGIVTQFQFEF